MISSDAGGAAPSAEVAALLSAFEAREAAQRRTFEEREAAQRRAFEEREAALRQAFEQRIEALEGQVHELQAVLSLAPPGLAAPADDAGGPAPADDDGAQAHQGMAYIFARAVEAVSDLFGVGSAEDLQVRSPTPEGLAWVFDRVSGLMRTPATKTALVIIRDSLLLMVTSMGASWTNVTLQEALEGVFGRTLMNSDDLSQFMLSFNTMWNCGRDPEECASRTRSTYGAGADLDPQVGACLFQAFRQVAVASPNWISKTKSATGTRRRRTRPRSPRGDRGRAAEPAAEGAGDPADGTGDSEDGAEGPEEDSEGFEVVDLAVAAALEESLAASQEAQRIELP